MHWWTQWRNANIGIATGLANRILGLDSDGEAGLGSLRQLKDERCLANTLLARSGRLERDGRRRSVHLYYLIPDGMKIGNSAGRLGPGLDVRGESGYLVAPPSLHKSGKRYEWINPDQPLAKARPALIEKLTKPWRSGEDLRRSNVIHEGFRNQSLFRLARSWWQKGASRREIERKLLAVNSHRCVPPLDDGEVRTIAANVQRYVKESNFDKAWGLVEKERHGTRWQKLVAVIRHLHKLQPELPLMLPVVKVSRLLGCDPKEISRFRKWAIAQGIIKVLREHVPHREATLFIYTGRGNAN